MTALKSLWSGFWAMLAGAAMAAGVAAGMVGLWLIAVAVLALVMVTLITPAAFAWRLGDLLARAAMGGG